jgi:hypothetical protein
MPMAGARLILDNLPHRLCERRDDSGERCELRALRTGEYQGSGWAASFNSRMLLGRIFNVESGGAWSRTASKPSHAAQQRPNNINSAGVLVPIVFLLPLALLIAGGVINWIIKGFRMNA